MKPISILLLLVALSSCNSNEMVYSRKRLMEYESSGYTIVINNTRPIKISNTFLDKREITKIELDEEHKIINLTRKDTVLHLITLYKLVHDTQLKKQLLLIDGFPIENKDLETNQLESNAMQSIKVTSDSIGNFGKLEKVYSIETYDNTK